MQNGIVADRDALFQHGALLRLGMDYGVILHIALSTDADRTKISTQDGAEQYAGALANHDIAYEYSGRSNEGCGCDLWAPPFKANKSWHIAGILPCSSTGSVSEINQRHNCILFDVAHGVARNYFPQVLMVHDINQGRITLKARDRVDFRPAAHVKADEMVDAGINGRLFRLMYRRAINDEKLSHFEPPILPYEPRRKAGQIMPAAFIAFISP
jgi:hypothetical protein